MGKKWDFLGQKMGFFRTLFKRVHVTLFAVSIYILLLKKVNYALTKKVKNSQW